MLWFSKVFLAEASNTLSDHVKMDIVTATAPSNSVRSPNYQPDFDQTMHLNAPVLGRRVPLGDPFMWPREGIKEDVILHKKEAGFHDLFVCERSGLLVQP